MEAVVAHAGVPVWHLLGYLVPTKLFLFAEVHEQVVLLLAPHPGGGFVSGLEEVLAGQE